MKRWSAVPRAVAVWAGIVVAVGVYGCNPHTLPGARVVYYPPDDWDADLPPGVSANPGDFLRTVAPDSPRDTVHVRARPGRCAMLCTVDVRIRTLGRTGEIDAQNGPDAGRAVARIENLDPTDIEALFGFRPSTEAEYFFWVDRNPSTRRARLTALWVPRSGGSVRAGHQKDLILCHLHPPGYTRISEVDFYEYKHRVGEPCTAPEAAKASRVGEASLFSVRPFLALYERVKGLLSGEMIADGAWIDCNSGCCT